MTSEQIIGRLHIFKVGVSVDGDIANGFPDLILGKGII
jgi:hypothetical protein